jgi:beta-lactamase superfamily II metal-dependent hydrolase
MRTLSAALIAACLVAFASAQPRTAPTLDLYLIDVEGGNATLIVSPARESLLIDTGNGGMAAMRDAERIMAAVRDANLTQIDRLITTHYHGDHYGAMAEVTTRIPVKEFIDHGPSVENNPGLTDFLQKTYPSLYAKGTHTVAKPGDRIAMKGLDARVVASAGQMLQSALPAAGRPNPACVAFKQQTPDTGENAQSVGTHIVFGRFRLVHMGDLTVNKEAELMCPNNRLGTVDLMVASHHGQAISNADVLVHALEPRVILINNGIRKGGQPDAMKVFFSSPGLENVWQLHFSQLSGQEHTVPGLFIANTVDDQPANMPIAPFVQPAPGAGAAPGGPPQPPPVHNGQAFWLKVSAKDDGSFTVTNARNGFSKTYAARAR